MKTVMHMHMLTLPMCIGFSHKNNDWLFTSKSSISGRMGKAWFCLLAADVTISLVVWLHPDPFLINRLWCFLYFFETGFHTWMHLNVYPLCFAKASLCFPTAQDYWQLLIQHLEWLNLFFQDVQGWTSEEIWDTAVGSTKTERTCCMATV